MAFIRTMRAVAFAVAALSCGLSFAAEPGRTTPDDLYFVDAHSQMDHNVTEEQVLALMGQGGVYRTLLSHHLRRPWSDVVAFAERHPEQIVPMLRTKGQGFGVAQFSTWQADFFRQPASRFRGMAEVLLWHEGDPSKGIPKIQAAMNSEWVSTTYDLVLNNNWPYLAHIEFASLPDVERARYRVGLETLARRNRTLPIVLMHMGQLDAAAAAELIRDHPNIHFMMSQSNPITRKMMQGALPFVNLFHGPALTAQWSELVSRHPDRFVFALDNVFAPMWHQSAYMAQMTLWWSALAKLEPAVAHAVAHGNAERLWKLDPKPATIAIRAPALSTGKAAAGALKKGKGKAKAK